MDRPATNFPSRRLLRRFCRRCASHSAAHVSHIPITQQIFRTIERPRSEQGHGIGVPSVLRVLGETLL